jgi:hypothetical protein
MLLSSLKSDKVNESHENNEARNKKKGLILSKMGWHNKIDSITDSWFAIPV